MATQLSPPRPAREASEEAVETSELLELLGDEYTQRVLTALLDGPRSGREVMETANVSKATAYRRLGDLEEAGLVESEMVFDPDGHHHEKFSLVAGAIGIEFDEEGVEVVVETEGGSRTKSNRHRIVYEAD